MGSSNLTDNIGCIEVIVLRCAGTRSAKCASKDDAKGINLDGANDLPDHWDFHTPGGPQYDDRSWQHVGSNAHPSRYDASTRASSYHNSGPPPPLPSHSYVTNTHYNSPVPRQGTGNFVPGYRYGSGPIAHQSRVPSVVGPASSVAGAGAPAIDLAWLDNRLADAVNRGFEKYQGSKASPPSQPISAAPAVGYSVSAPGAWPSLPEDLVLDTDPKPQSHQSNAHIIWDVPLAARAQSDEKGYYSISETSSSDSWGEQKHRDKKQNTKQGSDVRDRRSEHDTHGWTSVRHQQTSPAIRSHQTGDWARSSDFHSARSGPQEPVWESRSDKDGWTIVNAGSSHNDPWTSPRSVHPSESISVAIPAPNLLATKLHSLSVRNDKSQRRSASAAQSSNWESVPPWGALEMDNSLAGVPPFSTAEYAWDVPKKQTSKKVAATSNSDNGWSPVECAVSPDVRGAKKVKSTGWETEEAKSTGWETEKPKVTGWDDEDEKSTSWDIEKSKPTDWKFETVKATDWDTKADKSSGLGTENVKPTSWDIKHQRSQAWWEPQNTKVDRWDTVDTKPTDWDIEETKAKPWPYKEAKPASPKKEHKHQHKTATQTPPKQASLSRWLVSEPTDKAPKPDPWTAAAAPAKPVPSTQKPKYTATPSRYEHPIGRPIYIDTPEKPVSHCSSPSSRVSTANQLIVCLFHLQVPQPRLPAITPRLRGPQLPVPLRQGIERTSPRGREARDARRTAR